MEEKVRWQARAHGINWVCHMSHYALEIELRNRWDGQFNPQLCLPSAEGHHLVKECLSPAIYFLWFFSQGMNTGV